MLIAAGANVAGMAIPDFPLAFGLLASIQLVAWLWPATLKREPEPFQG